MICRRCGKENSDQARFCKQCGSELASQYHNGPDRRHDPAARYDDDGTLDYSEYSYGGYMSRDDFRRTDDRRYADDGRDLRYPDDGGDVRYADGGRDPRYGDGGRDPRYGDGGRDPRYGDGGRDPRYGDGGRDVRYPDDYVDLDEVAGPGGQGSGPPKFLFFLIAGISVLIIILSGVFLWTQMRPDSDTKADNKTEADKDSDSATDYTEEPLNPNRSVVGEKEYADLSPDDPGMDYTNNVKCQFGLHDVPGDFARLDYDNGRYSFAYPKFLFNRSIVKKDDKSESYYFYYENEDGEKEIPSLYVSCYDDPGDIMEKTRSLYEEYSEWTVPDPQNEHISSKPFKNNDNINIADGRYHARSAETGTTNMFIVVSNDGKRSHVWIFEYPPVDDGDPESDHVKYVVQNAYRFCSFGGTEKKTRTFDQFMKDEEPETNKKKK